MTDDELELVRTWVGDTPSDAELQEIYARVEDLATVVRQVLRKRLANLLAQPASLSVPGEVSINNAANIAALQNSLDLLSRLGIRGERSVVPARVVAPPERAER